MKTCIFFIQISLMFVPEGPINNTPVLAQIMTWHRTGTKPFYELMGTYATKAYTQHSASASRDWLYKYFYIAKPPAKVQSDWTRAFQFFTRSHDTWRLAQYAYSWCFMEFAMKLDPVSISRPSFQYGVLIIRLTRSGMSLKLIPCKMWVNPLRFVEAYKQGHLWLG